MALKAVPPGHVVHAAHATPDGLMPARKVLGQQKAIFVEDREAAQSNSGSFKKILIDSGLCRI